MKASGKANSPRRPIKREYLATLNAAVPLETWQGSRESTRRALNYYRKKGETQLSAQCHAESGAVGSQNGDSPLGLAEEVAT